ncbi:hypothetical protein DC522_10090 [Microvirga sp. KLBC 81]|uniref:cadherin domain-containing protein n=1 Tax=Microvirga sp. KLBC 81 TaxID=1862707 RepID=UPI000D5182C1|nr:cadherin domain-containing protein [Microvirga sp. KLBC 81]PVE24436.1 hypothetical protein DC522_10090 [Microvirga sp. KLBC 81]
MADYYFDPSNPPNSVDGYDTDNAVKLAAGTAFFGRTFYNSTTGGDAVRAIGIQDITIIPGVTIRGQNDGINFAAAGISTNANRVFNGGGFISSVTGAGIHFAAGGEGIVTNQGTITGPTGIKMDNNGKLEVLNTGTIVASGKAVVSGSGQDKVVNTGLIRSTGTEGIAIDLGAGDDIYDGSAGAVIGKIVLGEGSDRAYGGAGSEVFAGGQGNDFIDGGAGSDTVDYSGATGGINVDLSQTGQQAIGGGNDSDTLVNIENIIGGQHSDWIKGNGADNVLEGGAGNDTFEGGAGSDTLLGGEGEDTANYYGTAAIRVDLRFNGVSQNTLGSGWDTLKDIENVNGSSNWDTIDGSDTANKLWGWSGSDSLNGHGGNDTLEGADGNDTLDGGADNDSLKGGIGNDSLIGGIGTDELIGEAGNDTLWGGDGNDMAVFFGLKAAYNISVTTADENTSYTVTHKVPAAENSQDTIVGAGGVDSLKGIRLLKFLGNNLTDASDDQLYAFSNSAAPTVVNLSGSGVKENSNVGTVVGVLSATDADGDALTYTLLTDAGGLFELDDDGKTILVKKKEGLDYELHSTFTIKVRVSDGIKNVSDDATVGTADRDVVIKIINEAEAGNVTRIGTSASESLSGELGNDIIRGMGGSDTISGATGNDKIFGGTGGDRLTGGDGYDRFYFDTAPSSSYYDIITDFNPVYDTIYLSRAIFSGISRTGTLSSTAFKVGNSFDSSDRIVYEPGSGGLFYDRDGAATTYKWVQIADLEAGLRLTYRDIVVY